MSLARRPRVGDWVRLKDTTYTKGYEGTEHKIVRLTREEPLITYPAPTYKRVVKHSGVLVYEVVMNGIDITVPRDCFDLLGPAPK